MALYGRIDLHGNNNVTVVIDWDDGNGKDLRGGRIDPAIGGSAIGGSAIVH